MSLRNINKPKDPAFLRLSQQTPHKTAEVLYKKILWYFQRQNSFSEHPKNQVFFPLQR